MTADNIAKTLDLEVFNNKILIENSLCEMQKSTWFEEKDFQNLFIKKNSDFGKYFQLQI